MKISYPFTGKTMSSSVGALGSRAGLVRADLMTLIS